MLLIGSLGTEAGLGGDENPVFNMECEGPVGELYGMSMKILKM